VVACLLQHRINQLERHLTGQLTQMSQSKHSTATVTVTGQFLLSLDRQILPWWWSARRNGWQTGTATEASLQVILVDTVNYPALPQGREGRKGGCYEQVNDFSSS
jgi:hypothetical protein